MDASVTASNLRYRKLCKKELILLDGAMGTELDKVMCDPKLPWSLDGLVFAPGTVCNLHQSYIEAGADVVITNAFRTNRRTLQRVDWRGVALNGLENEVLGGEQTTLGGEQLEKLLTRRAVEVAKKARRAHDDVCVAGNLSPLEDCFASEKSPAPAAALPEHRHKARHLAQAGVDLLLVETMNSLAESECALRACLETGLPVWISFVGSAWGTLLSGESLDCAIEMLKRYLPSTLDAVLLNCCLPEEIDRLLPPLAQQLRGLPLRFGAYANLEAPNVQGVWQRRTKLTPKRYLDHAKRWVDQGATIVGGCCGSTPEDILVLREGLRGV